MQTARTDANIISLRLTNPGGRLASQNLAHPALLSLHSFPPSASAHPLAQRITNLPTVRPTIQESFKLISKFIPRPYAFARGDSYSVVLGLIQPEADRKERRVG